MISLRAVTSNWSLFQGVKGRMYGFELHIQDKLYSLVADSQSEMDAWISCLCKVTGIDMDSGSKNSGLNLLVSKVKAPKLHQSLRESLKGSKHPELLEFAKETEVLNAKRRKDGRKKLFSLVHDLDNNGTCVNYDDARIDADVFEQHFGLRLVLEVEELKFRLLRTLHDGSEVNIEPFFLSMSLFDAKVGAKISEDFHCDLNDPSTVDMLRGSELIENGEANGNGVDHQEFGSHELIYSSPRKVGLDSVFNLFFLQILSGPELLSKLFFQWRTLAWSIRSEKNCGLGLDQVPPSGTCLRPWRQVFPIRTRSLPANNIYMYML